MSNLFIYIKVAFAVHVGQIANVIKVVELVNETKLIFNSLRSVRRVIKVVQLISVVRYPTYVPITPVELDVSIWLVMLED